MNYNKPEVFYMSDHGKITHYAVFIPVDTSDKKIKEIQSRLNIDQSIKEIINATRSTGITKEDPIEIRSKKSNRGRKKESYKDYSPMIGKKINNWTIIKHLRDHNPRTKSVYFKAKCKCGNVKTTQIGAMKISKNCIKCRWK